MINFALAVFFLIITPGPGVLSAAGVGAAYGWSTGLKYILGLFVGTNLVAIAVISGISIWVVSNPFLRISLLVLSTGYLLFLAFQIATAGKKLSFIKPASQPGVLAGLILQPINPKAYFVNTVLFNGFSIYEENVLLEVTIKFFILNSIWIPIHIIWLFFGISIKKINLNDVISSRINVALAMSIVAVVILSFLSGFS